MKKDQIRYVTHRIVHGGENKKPLVVTKEHPEALKDMDKLGEFAPLHVSCAETPVGGKSLTVRTTTPSSASVLASTCCLRARTCSASTRCST